VKVVSRFHGPPVSPEYYRALLALYDVPAGDRDRVFADSIAQHIEERFAEAFQLKKSSGSLCVQRLLGKRCGKGKIWANCECFPPGTDHASLWLKDGKPALFVSQPYGITANTMQDMQKFAKENGLEFDVGAEMSWWFPSRTVLVCWRAKGSRVVSGADKRDFL
jgi:hypothetical protein